MQKKNQYDEKKKKKLEYLVSGLKVVGAATSSGHKQTHLCYTTTIPVICSLLHSHTKEGGGRLQDISPPTCSLLTVSDLVGRKVI